MKLFTNVLEVLFVNKVDLLDEKFKRMFLEIKCILTAVPKYDTCIVHIKVTFRKCSLLAL